MLEKKWSCLKTILCFLEKTARCIGGVESKDRAIHARPRLGIFLSIYLRGKHTTPIEQIESERKTIIVKIKEIYGNIKK